MKTPVQILLLLCCTIVLSNCNVQKSDPFRARVVYRSDNLVITQISRNTYEHTSFLQTEDFGKVPCNGLIVCSNQEAVIFDTPAEAQSSEVLIRWIKEALGCRVTAVIPTHFHSDCLGGLKVFHDRDIPSYAYFKTTELARSHNFEVPQNSFRDSLIFAVGTQNVIVKFFGEGHTKDNVTGYFPGDQVIFGGCLVKELNAGKGYLGDANTGDWSHTVEKIKKEYPDVKLVVPGHGAYGNSELLDYTIRLFKPR